MGTLMAFFSTPARQALGWTLLGLIGIGMAAGGVWFLTDDGGGPKIADAGGGLATETSPATATRSASLSATITQTASPSPSETATPTATATTPPNTGGTGSLAGGTQPTATPEPEPAAVEPEPAAPPVVAGGDYCPSISSSSPPNSVFGLFKIGGVDVPAGETVSLAFDGVVGPSRATTNAGGYRVDYNAGPENCANRVGAAIAIVHNGVFYATGSTVGGGGPALRFDVVN